VTRREWPRQALFWSLVLAATTAALLPYRAILEKAHVALVLLLVVLGAGARGGRGLGLGIGVASFLVFDVVFVPPYGRVAVDNPLDWLVLVAFLITSAVASQLLHRAQEASRAASEERERLDEERKQTEALRATDALKDALLASVSHDLRTPLTSIKALANQLGALGDERSQIIEEQADRLGRDVSDLLDLSRLSAGAMPVRLEVNAVDDLLSAAIVETEARLAGRPLEVRLPPDGVLLAGRFDLSLSVRILTNLIENAHKYSPAGQPISVEALRQGTRLRVAVRDRGPGVAAEEEERIFETFYRPLSAPADKGSAGLGLALARRMAELQHGALTYAPRPGGGSDFILSLPAVDVPGLGAAGSL
jgi:two-component system sensor histidine kinase KdpD